MDNIKVTVITPSYNQGEFIEKTIQSVLNQTYKNIQYIVVDGNSTDNTMDIVNKYKSQIDIVIHEKDKGQSDAINKGFKLAEGELVGWINSDDVLYEDCVEKIVELYTQNPGGAIYHGNTIDRIDKDGAYINSYTYHIPNRHHLLHNDYFVVQPGSFYSNSILKNINYIDEKIHYCMDLDLWIRLLEHGNIYPYKEKAIATIRKWEGTKTSTGANKFLKEIKKNLVKHGATPFSRNIFKIRYQMFKNNIKAILHK